MSLGKSFQIRNPKQQHLIRDFLQANPSIPALTLAKRLVRENPGLWANVESCRSSIRVVLGSMGNRKSPSPELTRPKRDPSKPMHLPPTLAVSRPSLHIPGPLDALILSDIHVPYHDNVAIEAAINHAKENYKINLILLNGDIFDFYSVSRHEKDPAKRNLGREIKDGTAFLQWLRGQFPEARIIFKKGNHEERWDHWIWANMPELHDFPGLQMENAFKFGDFGIQMAPRRALITLGKLPILHAHELARGLATPVNPARGFFMKTGSPMMGGHLHRTSEHTEPSMMGDFVTCWSTGCLCGLWPEYAVVNKWNHGFARVKVLDDGSFHVDNRRINEGEVY